ncbi:MAG: hypothetical protein ACQETD_07015 [Pseudomonadota bacterium]
MKALTHLPALALAALFSTALALPATAAAHGTVSERHITVYKTESRHHKHHGKRRHGESAHQRRSTSRWAPPRRGHGPRHHSRQRHQSPPHTKRGPHHGDYRGHQPQKQRPIYRSRHRDDGIRVRIDYDFRL